MAVTIMDIAKESGVSIATVSRLINNSGYVGKASREKIESAIQKLNYTPNAAAVSLSKRESKVIGVMVPEVANPFYGEIIKGINTIADEKGYAVMLFNTKESSFLEMNALSTLKQQNLCGLILTPVIDDATGNSEFYDALSKLQTPCIFMDRMVEHYNCPGVFWDNQKGTYDLTTSLIKDGHKKIALLAGSQHLKIGRDRLEGFKEAMEDHDISEYGSIYYCDFDHQNARNKAKEICKSEDMPTAILACNNRMAEGIIQGLNELDSIHKFSLASYDELYWTSFIGLPIKYLERSPMTMGVEAAKLLLKLNNNEKADATIMCDAQVISQ